MKINENNPLHAQALARYLAGEMDDAERALFEQQYMSSTEEKIILDEMKKQWNVLERYKIPQPIDTQTAWEKLNHRLNSEELIPAQEKKETIRLFSKMMRYAAILVVLLGVGTLVYLGLNRKPKIEMVDVNFPAGSATLVKTLSDGSVIYLTGNSSFSFPEEFDAGTRNVTLKGEAFFDIARDPSKPFIIETEKARIEVLGTEFNVHTGNGDDFELNVTHGKVKVSMKDNALAQEFVSAGERVSIANNRLIRTKNTGINYRSLYTSEMQFKDELLKNIIHVLNQNFSTTFVTANQEVGNRKLTLTYTGETPELLTELICQALNLKSQTKDDSIVLSQNKGPAR